MEIKDVYRPAIATCAPDDSLHEVATMMVDADSGFVAVTVEGRLTGVVSERDLVGAMARDLDPHTATAADVATTEVLTADLDEAVSAAARRMIDHGVRRLPVVHAEGAVVGMVSMRDVFALETLMAGQHPGGPDA